MLSYSVPTVRSRRSSIIHKRDIQPRDYKIGDNILVKRVLRGILDDHIATVVEIKDIDQESLKDYVKNHSHDPETPSTSATHHDDSTRVYYVHYAHQDRRLDEWIDKSMIVGLHRGIIPLPISIPTKRKGLKDSIIVTRKQRKIAEEFKHALVEETDPRLAKLERERIELTKVKNIETVTLGKYTMEAWYFSPFAEKFTNSKHLYFCDFCLEYSNVKEKVQEHQEYCQSLCLLAKLFLDHKTLYYDIEGFIFYVLCHWYNDGAHIVGYFSKEIVSYNNLACIMVFPPFQRYGYGKLLIQLSYWMSQRQGVIGTPEKPLSDLGKIGYKSFWWWLLLSRMDELNINSNITVEQLSKFTGVHPQDIHSTFDPIGLVRKHNGLLFLKINRAQIRSLMKKMCKKPKILLNPSYLMWKPDTSHRGMNYGSWLCQQELKKH